MQRDLDHIVIGVRDLDAAASAWTSLGFTVAPTARHPFGTENRIIQLQGSFIELISVADETVIPKEAVSGGVFSFPAFVRNALKQREGPAMVVVRGEGPEKDRAAFAAAGLPLFEPFAFGRKARGPDGVEREVSFDLTFTQDETTPEIGFFACHNRFPENFWKEAYQSHANGMTSLVELVLVSLKPQSNVAFLERLLGEERVEIKDGGECIGSRVGCVSVLSPKVFADHFGKYPQGIREDCDAFIGALVFAGGEGNAITQEEERWPGCRSEALLMKVEPVEVMGTVVVLMPVATT